MSRPTALILTLLVSTVLIIGCKRQNLDPVNNTASKQAQKEFVACPCSTVSLADGKRLCFFKTHVR
jgi:hypothetical protein